MALWSPRLQRFILNNYNNLFAKIDLKKNILTSQKWSSKSIGRCCSAIAIDTPSSLSDGVGSGIRWGSAKLQGAREEMEDDAVIVSNNDLDDYKGIEIALQEAFENANAKLLNWLEMNGDDDESGATATNIFIGNDMLFISHVGDSSAVLSQSRKAEELTDSHKPYGRSKASLHEIKRIKEAGIKDEEASKGLVAEKIFASMAENGKQADFVLCIGDDRSDEDMFKIIGNAISGNMLLVNTNMFACTSGQKPRKAKYYLDDTSKVILLLKNFAEATDSPVVI
ncbi:protein phosphatase 2C 57 [Tanacetum coccineum]